MKIISEGLFGKNIQFVCSRCNCVYEVESRDDWKIYMIRLWKGGRYEVPDYNVVCPNCGDEQHLGCDPDDLRGTEAECMYCAWTPFLKEGRKDWNERYRINPIITKIGE